MHELHEETTVTTYSLTGLTIAEVVALRRATGLMREGNPLAGVYDALKDALIGRQYPDLGTLKATVHDEAENGYTYPHGPVQSLWFESRGD